jgi:hypothetical protein
MVVLEIPGIDLSNSAIVFEALHDLLLGRKQTMANTTVLLFVVTSCDHAKGSAVPEALGSISSEEAIVAY